MRPMKKKPFKVGERVRVIGMQVAKYAPGVKDELGTEKLFRYMLGKVYTVKGYDEYGFVELEPRPRRDTVWIHPEFLQPRARRKRAKVRSG